MLVKVLKPFNFSRDGRTSERAEVSDDPDARVDVPDQLCAGLSGEGFIDGSEHGLPLLSPARRTAIIDEIVAGGRAELDKLSDEQLTEIVGQKRAAEERQAREAIETKVIEAAPEASAPAPVAESVQEAAADAPAAPRKGKKAADAPAAE